MDVWSMLVKKAGGQILSKQTQLSQATIIIDTQESFEKKFPGAAASGSAKPTRKGGRQAKAKQQVGASEAEESSKHYTADLILNGILQQKLDFETHRISN